MKVLPVNRLPRLIVFDLDFTLWDCGGTWYDCLTPPFAMKAGRPVDSLSRSIRLYDDVATILDWCDEQSIAMALASRTEQPTWARELVDKLDIADRFQFAEIYPSSKLRHFQALMNASTVAPQEMLFFDDEMRNIREVATLGVTTVHVEHGLTRRLFDDGLERFSANTSPRS